MPYTTPAKVLLSGLGSDELLGGYSRHKKAFRDASWQGLIDEVRLSLMASACVADMRPYSYNWMLLDFQVAILDAMIALFPQTGKKRGTLFYH